MGKKGLAEHGDGQRRDPTTRRYVYWWADGVHFNLGGENDDRACPLVIIGVLPEGTKEFVGLGDGLRDQQGLTSVPQLAIGDGTLGLWKALEQVSPGTCHQRCLDAQDRQRVEQAAQAQPAEGEVLPAGNLDGASRDDAQRAFDAFAAALSAKYPKAVATLQKDR